MKHRVVISKKNNTFPLKGLNELLSGRLYNFRTKKYHNPVKADNDKVCFMAIKKCIPNVKIENSIKCTYFIYAGDKRHDRSNLYSAIEKSFPDALQQARVISNDSWDCVYDSEFHTFLDRKNPRVEVEIIECEKLD